MTSSSSDRVSVAFLILILGTLTVARGQVQQCAGFGEYCQNHWDCCSNTCMSYLYRCTRNYDVFPFAFGGAYPPVHSTLEEILDLNFGNSIRAPVEVQIRPVAFYPRFGGSDELNSDFEVVQRDVQQTTTTEKPVICQVAEADAVSAEAKKKDEIISAAKATTTTTDTADDDTKITTEDVKRSAVTNSTTTEPATTTVKSSSTGTTEPPELVSVIRTGSTTTTTTTSPDTTSTPSTPSTRCSVVGSKCYRNEECCTVRCHGFLHQCVT